MRISTALRSPPAALTGLAALFLVGSCTPPSPAQTARRRPPPGRRVAPVPLPAANLLAIPNAKGVKKLSFAQGAKLPFVKVPVARIVAMARTTCGEQWYGMYLRKRKLGYARIGCALKTVAGKPVLESTSVFVIQGKMYGQAMRYVSRSRSVNATTGVGELLLYEGEETSKQQRKTVRIVRRPDGWHARRTYRAGAIHKPDRTRVIKKMAANLTNGENAFATLLVEGRLKPGARYRTWGFDTDEWKDRESAIQLLASVRRPLRGVKVLLHKVETLGLEKRYRGVAVSDGRGNWLDASLYGAIRIRLEERATAKRIVPGGGDLGLGVVIRTRRLIRHPARVSRLRLQLDGFLPPTMARTGRHKLVLESKRSARLTIKRESLTGLPKVTLPVKAKKLAKYLKATPDIESDDKLIRGLARRVIGRETDALAAARKLNRFVFRYLKKSLSSNLDSAVAIARARAGDCTEHARLMVALCRAVGLPAREVGGVTYVPDIRGFGYHAWTEVWVGRWITADPSWNEVPANATHIQMGNADDADWIGTLGALKIRILSAQ